MAEICLTLLCPRGTEEKVLDVILSLPETTLLTSAPRMVHGLSSSELDAAEQVLGGARATEIQVLLMESARTGVLEELRQSFRGSGIRYWLTRVTDFGALT